MVAICHLAPGGTALSRETEGESPWWPELGWHLGAALPPLKCSSVFSDQRVCFPVARGSALHGSEDEYPALGEVVS